MGKVIWLQLQIWTQMFLILKKLINKTFYLITFLWITDQGMTITTILNLLHFVYKYVVLFCESSSADTACKFLEVFLVQRWQNYFKNMLQKSQRTWTSTIWNYTCSMLAKKVAQWTWHLQEVLIGMPSHPLWQAIALVIGNDPVNIAVSRKVVRNCSPK